MIGKHPFLDLFLQSYADCALFASCGDDMMPLDRKYSVQNIAPDSIERMEKDCNDFFVANNLGQMSNREIMRAGHDFWLTRNNHGAGFWDGDWPEPQAAFLTASSHSFGTSDLYVGDDGCLHVSITHKKGGEAHEA